MLPMRGVWFIPRKQMENKSLFNWVVRNNFPDADFWLINKGDTNIGKPVKEFQPFLTGIQCPAKILPAAWILFVSAFLQHRNLASIRFRFNQLQKPPNQRYSQFL